MTEKIIDIHVHTGGPGDVYKDDLYWHKRFEQGIGFQALKVLKGWIFKNVKELKEYYSEEKYKEIFTNFHRLLDRLGRGHLIS